MEGEVYKSFLRNLHQLAGSHYSMWWFLGLEVRPSSGHTENTYISSGNLAALKKTLLETASEYIQFRQAMLAACQEINQAASK